MAELKVKKDKSLEVIYGEIIKDEQGVEPIEYDGRQVGLMGYASKKDREVQLGMLRKVLEDSDGIMDAMSKLSQIAQCVKAEVVPDETVEVNGVKVVLSYKDKKSYIVGVNGIETISKDLGELNLPTIGKDALKELLIRDTERVLAQRELEECEDDCDY